jgi:DNA polymerase-3 subunit beta
MEVTLSKQCLSAALSRTSGIADRKSSMQILSNAMIAAEGPKQVLVATTDLNISASGVLPADVAKGGSITLPAKTLNDIVRNLPGGEVTIRVDGDTGSITSGRSQFKLLGLPAEDFPRLPDVSGVEFFDLDAEMVVKMIERSSFSISSDETRPHINGALFQGDGKVLRMVTTDGHRLSKVEHKLDESGFYNFSMVVPNKGIIEIKRLLDEGQGPVSIGSLEGSVFVRREVEVEKGSEGATPQTAEFVLVSKLIEAEFPPYDQVIPKSKERSVVVPRAALLEALRRVSVVSSERTLGVKFQLSEGALEISTDNPSVGEGSELIDIGYEGEELVIGFNARYFIEVLSVLEDDDVTLELSGNLDPAVIKDDSSGYIGVIMPMRI